MTSKERVRTAISHKEPDRLPANFQCVESVMQKLQKHYGFSDSEQVYQKFEIDIREVYPQYIGPKLKQWNNNGEKTIENYWGFRTTYHWTGSEYHGMLSYAPLDHMHTVADLEQHEWPSPDWFDYESIKWQCEKYVDKAIIMGHEGPFQMATNLRSMDKLLMNMAIDPEFAETIYTKMHQFELEYYERVLQVADGQIDIIRPHDDYGTQLNLLFSPKMWNYFMKDNTKGLVELSHAYGAFYQQHSCGAVRDIISNLVQCGVDVLEPLQKVQGMNPSNLKQNFGKDLAFHGGVDTQSVLPYGTVEEVKQETLAVIHALHHDGGYILMASQSFESDVPIENIEALYSVRD